MYTQKYINKKIKKCVTVCHCLLLFCNPNIFAGVVVASRLLSVTMADADDTSEPDESCFSVPIIARLTVHTGGGPGSKKKATRKDTKTKEFSHVFRATKANYLEFLNTFLVKHHIHSKLRVTDRRRYTCKMQVPPST